MRLSETAQRLSSSSSSSHLLHESDKNAEWPARQRCSRKRVNPHFDLEATGVARAAPEFPVAFAVAFDSTPGEM
jgi:hypothetical protein